MVLFIIPPLTLFLFTHHHIHLIVVKGGQCVFGLRQATRTVRPGCPSTNISQKPDHYFVDPIVLSAWKATSVKIIMHQSAPECSSRV